MPRPSEESELEELPPLDNDDDPDHEGPLDHEPEPLADLLDEDVDMDEDDQAPDVELGLEVEEVDAEPDEHTDLVLDIAAMLAFADEREPAPEGDTLGPDRVDLDIGMDERDEGLTGSSEEGADDRLEDLVSEDLPELDADEPGGFDEPAWLGDEALRDEELPSFDAEPWQVVHVGNVATELSAAVAVNGGAIVAGSALAWVSIDGRVALTELAGGHATSVADLGSGVVFVTTAGGELMRCVWTEGRAETVDAWRRALGERGGDAREIEVTSVTTKTGRRLLLCTGGALLAQSDDGGKTWASLELGGRVLRLTHECRPTLGLVQSAEARALVAWAPDGGLRRSELDAVAEDVASGEAPMLVAHEDLVVLATRERGLALSRDAGRSFVRVPGCLQASALAVGIVDGRPRVFCSVFVESEERSVIVEVDPTSARAHAIAEITLPEDDAATDGGDCRIEALAWDAGSRCIWAVGDLGVVRIEMPS